MNFDNPTRLRIGMRGNFSGKTYQLAGRSVLGERERGETYYWHEFNLESTTGEHAILVYDETEASAHWRMFTQFDPEYPMPAAEAATKQVGDRINLTGDDVRVTFRGASVVYYIEDQAAEGEQVGTEAEYFNAEAGSIMQVVSWTGEEVEFYNGVTLTPGLIAIGFGISQELMDPAYSYPVAQDSGPGLRALKWVIIAMFAVIFGVMILGKGCATSRRPEAAAVKKIHAGAPPLAVGATGRLFDKQYRVTAHAVVEMAEVGARWEQHEYDLTADAGATALLVCGGHDSTDWICYEPLSLLQPLTPEAAAAKNLGDPVQLDGYQGRVAGIFQCMVEPSSDNRATTGTLRYGFRTGETWPLLARWDETGIQFFRGHRLPAKTAAAGFAQVERSQ